MTARPLITALALTATLVLPAAAQDFPPVGAEGRDDAAPATLIDAGVPFGPALPPPDDDDGGRVTIELPTSPRRLSSAVEIALALTALALLPAALITATSFGRIIIVLGFIRVGLGTPNMPPTQVLVGLALSLTLLAMAPTAGQVWTDALGPYLREELDARQAATRAEAPFRAFLVRHVRERDLATFVGLARTDRPRTLDDVPLRALLPAFITSELTTAFEMGIVVLVPFLVIDLVVAAVLLAMNMMMLPPATIATPMKVLLFVLVDGWQLVARSLVASAG